MHTTCLSVRQPSISHYDGLCQLVESILAKLFFASLPPDCPQTLIKFLAFCFLSLTDGVSFPSLPPCLSSICSVSFTSPELGATPSPPTHTCKNSVLKLFLTPVLNNSHEAGCLAVVRCANSRQALFKYRSSYCSEEVGAKRCTSQPMGAFDTVLYFTTGTFYYQYL